MKHIFCRLGKTTAILALLIAALLLLPCTGAMAETWWDEDNPPELPDLWGETGPDSDINATQCIVKFDANGGAGTMPDQVFYLNTPQRLSQNVFTREDYHFLLWDTKPDGTGYDVTEMQELTMPKGSAPTITLYAQWGRDACSVWYHANDGSGREERQIIPTRTWEALRGDIFPRDGIALLGWDNSPEGNNVVYALNEQVYFDSEKEGTILNLYARWEDRPYEVIFDANGGNGAMPNQSILTNHPTALNKCKFWREGYVFAGWNTQVGHIVYDYDDQEIVNNLCRAGESIRLYAQWIRSDTDNKTILHFDANGGDGSMADQNIYCDILQTLNRNAFTRKGHRFIGWNTKPDGSGIALVDQEKVRIPTFTTPRFTLYAMWEPYTPPTTGDASTPALWLMLCAASAIALILLFRRKKCN